MKKMSALCLSMLLIANLTAVPAVAADYRAPLVTETQGEAAPFSLAVTSTVAEIYSSGTTVSVGASARYPTSYTAKIYVYVERSSNNSSWGSSTYVGSGSGSGGSVSFSGSKSVKSGYYYRAKVTVTVYNGSSLVESVTFTSSSTYVG